MKSGECIALLFGAALAAFLAHHHFAPETAANVQTVSFYAVQQTVSN
jgi:hypothetical protein